ncbi:MAG: hypothetical protein WDO74_23865 [Pseudomonadota bacterium]
MDRQRFEQALRLARNRLDAADLLDWPPYQAESTRILLRGVRAIEDAAIAFDADSNNPAPPGRAGDLRVLKDLCQRLEFASEGDAHLSRDQLLTQRRVRRLALRMTGSLRRAARTRRAIVLGRVGWLSALLAIIAAVVFAVRLRDRFHVVESSHYAPAYAAFAARNVIDGNQATEWLAPDGTPAWLDLKFDPAIQVTAVRVLNGHNSFYNDRATKVLEVTLFAGQSAVAHSELTLPGLEEPAQALTLPIAATGVTRIRFFAREYYGKGASLAELEVIEGSN